MHYTSEDVENIPEGAVFKLQGKNFKLTKKTSTAIAVSRYYWFDAVGDWLMRKLGRSGN